MANTWFDYDDVNAKINEGIARRDGPQPGDTMAPQAEFTRALAQSDVAPGWGMGFLAGANAGNAQVGKLVSMGLLPNGEQSVAYQAGVPLEASRKINRATAELQPIPYGLGTVAGAGLGLYGAAKSGGAAAVRGIGNMLAPVSKEFIGPIAPTVGKAMLEFAKNNPATVALTTGAGGYGASKVADWAYADPNAGKAPADAGKMKQTAPPRDPDWYDEMSGVTGLSRKTLQDMVRQDGGIRLSTVQTLSGMKGRPLTPQQRAMTLVEQSVAPLLQQAQASGDVDQERKIRANLAATMADIAGADPMNSSILEKLLAGVE